MERRGSRKYRVIYDWYPTQDGWVYVCAVIVYALYGRTMETVGDSDRTVWEALEATFLRLDLDSFEAVDVELCVEGFAKAAPERSPGLWSRLQTGVSRVAGHLDLEGT